MYELFANNADIKLRCFRWRSTAADLLVPTISVSMSGHKSGLLLHNTWYINHAKFKSFPTFDPPNTCTIVLFVPRGGTTKGFDIRLLPTILRLPRPNPSWDITFMHSMVLQVVWNNKERICLVLETYRKSTDIGQEKYVG